MGVSMFFFYFLFVIASLALTYGWVECPMNIWARIDGTGSSTSEIPIAGILGPALNTKRCLSKNVQWSVKPTWWVSSRRWRRYWLISCITTTQLKTSLDELSLRRGIFNATRAVLTRFQRANFRMVSTRSLISHPPLLFHDKLFEKCLIANSAKMLSLKILILIHQHLNFCCSWWFLGLKEGFRGGASKQ